MPDTTTHSQDPHDPLVGDLKSGASFKFLEGVGELPISDGHPSRRRSVLEVTLEKIAVQLERLIGVVPELDRGGRVHPKEEPNRISIVTGSEESQIEALSLAKKSIRDRVYVGKRKVVDLGGDSVVDKRAHNSSPSVVDAGAHSVGDGPGAGDASATPATEVTEDSLHTRLTFIEIDEGKAEEIYLAAQANLVDAAENLAHARNKTRDAETAYNDFVNGGAK